MGEKRGAELLYESDVSAAAGDPFDCRTRRSASLQQGSSDPLWIGNDVVFLHAKTGGMKSIQLPPGMKMRAISGPFQGEFRSGEFWNAEAGQTYGFLVFRQ